MNVLVNFIKLRFFDSKMNTKRGIITDYIPWLIIGIAVLVIVSIGIFLLRGQGENLIDKIKGLFGGI